MPSRWAAWPAVPSAPFDGRIYDDTRKHGELYLVLKIYLVKKIETYPGLKLCRADVPAPEEKTYHPQKIRKHIRTSPVEPGKLYLSSLVENLAKNMINNLVKNLAKNLGAGGWNFFFRRRYSRLRLSGLTWSDEEIQPPLP